MEVWALQNRYLPTNWYMHICIYVAFKEIGWLSSSRQKILASCSNICWFSQTIILIFHQKILFPLSMYFFYYILVYTQGWKLLWKVTALIFEKHDKIYNLLQFTLLSNSQEYIKGIKWGLPIHMLQAQPPKSSYQKLKDKLSTEQKETELEVSWLLALPYHPVAVRLGPTASLLRPLQQTVTSFLRLLTCSLWDKRKKLY